MDHYFHLIHETFFSSSLSQNNGYLCAFLFSQIEFVGRLWHTNAHFIILTKSLSCVCLPQIRIVTK